MKKFFTLPLLLAALVFGAAAPLFAAHHEHGSMDEMTPTSVIHVVTVSWKDGTSDEEIQKALDGVKQLAKHYDGITRVWIKSIKVQGGKANAFVMEFKDEEALEDYAGSDAQKAWYEVYIPIRERSATFDITN